MPTNDEIINKQNWIKSSEIVDDGKGLVSIKLNLNTLMNEARADQFRKDTDARMQSIKQDSSEAIKLIIAYMRVARSEMCLKDRAILLNKINLLEKELKKIEE